MRGHGLAPGARLGLLLARGALAAASDILTRGSLLVGGAGALVELDHQLVGAHEATDRLSPAARQQGREPRHHGVVAGDEDVEAPGFERVDDLLGDVLGLDGLDQLPLGDPGREFRVDQSRHHAGHLYAGVLQLGHRRLAEADDGVLGRRVGRDPRQRRLARLGGDVDDVAAAARAQPFDRQLGADDDAVEVDVELAPDRLVGLVDQLGHRHDPGVVDHHVDGSQLALGGVEEGGEGAAIGDIEGERHRPSPKTRGRLFGQGEVEVSDRHAAALAD